MDPSKKFRGHVELPNNGAIIDLVGEDAGTLKTNVDNLLRGGCRFEVAGSAQEPAVLIYHPTLDNGKTVIGWIAPGIAAPMTNAAFLESRHLQKQAA